MRKIITMLLVSLFIVGITFNAVDANSNTKNAHPNTIFQYVITPESPEWKNLKTAELKEMLNIPVSETKSMDTETLLNVVLDYPFLGDIYAFNDPVKAIDLLAEQFNGLAVLLEREDFKNTLIKNYYNSYDRIIKLQDGEKIDNEERYKHSYRETLLCHPIVSEKLSESEKDTIILKSKKVAAKIDSAFRISEEPMKVESEVILAGEPPQAGDLIGMGVVYTPEYTSIYVVRYLNYLTEEDRQAKDDYVAERYPQATKLRSATYNYNCHSYAWYSKSIYNTWWMDDPSAYMTDGSYTQVNSLYPTASYQKMYYDIPGNEHSAIVISPSSDFYSVVVDSKWGLYGLYRHTPDYCPYFSPVYLLSNFTYWE